MYYLLEHRNRYGDHFYPTRRGRLYLGVVHITAGLQQAYHDFGKTDHSAEQTMRWCSQTPNKVSWHLSADSDSWHWLLPLSYTAWHVRNFNSVSVGLEISKRDTSWGDEHKGWVDATIHNAAMCGAEMVRGGIALRRVTRREADAGVSGFISHQELDPTRRRDPGADFPWDHFFASIHSVVHGPPPTPEPTPRPSRPVVRRGDKGPWVGHVQRLLVEHHAHQPARLYRNGRPDGVYGSGMYIEVREFQRARRLVPDGVVGRKTWGKLEGWE